MSSIITSAIKTVFNLENTSAALSASKVNGVRVFNQTIKVDASVWEECLENYKSKEDLEEECEEDDMDKNISFGESESNLIAEILINNKIENEAQIVEFINYVYRPKSEHVTDSPFKLTNVSDKTVLGVLWKYTERFNKTTALGFNQWLKKQNIDFLIEEPELKVLKLPGSETEKLRIRVLSVLDSQFHGKLENGIIGQDNMLTPVL
ncbi:hypothetical protein BD560DRAFT_72247 [Blakeslea trispora]|nr:hypothetical protein BD560DRAFT_72247 [Blakeslea trispora]